MSDEKGVVNYFQINALTFGNTTKTVNVQSLYPKLNKNVVFSRVNNIVQSITNEILLINDTDQLEAMKTFGMSKNKSLFCTT